MKNKRQNKNQNVKTNHRKCTNTYSSIISSQNAAKVADFPEIDG